jgi:hypothetical protein
MQSYLLELAKDAELKVYEQGYPIPVRYIYPQAKLGWLEDSDYSELKKLALVRNASLIINDNQEIEFASRDKEPR